MHDATRVLRDVIHGPAAWRGPEIQDDPSWVMHFDGQDLAEIDAALAQAKSAGAQVPFGRDEFPLSRLAAKLDAALEEIENGRGFVLLRGIPRHRYSDRDCEKIYWGLGIRLGNPVSQNARGRRLGHVRDEGRLYADPNARGYQTNQRMDFHADSLPVDVLGLFCLRAAKAGGASKLVSALTVHNVLLDERPDLLEVLYGPFYVDWRGEEPEGETPWFRNPMFSQCGGKISKRICSRPYFESAARFGEQCRPSAIQLEALDYVQAICNRPELMLTMDFQEGDIQLINNHILLHAREAFEDHAEPGRERHLLRMWIAVDDARRRPLADALAGSLSLGARGWHSGQGAGFENVLML